MRQPLSTPLLLPPAVRTSLDARIDSTGILPPNMVSAIVARIYSDPATRERLHSIAQGIMDHLLSDEPGWGNWPNDVGEAIYVGLILRIWLRDAVSAEKPGLTKQELNRLEETIIERIIERKGQVDLCLKAIRTTRHGGSHHSTLKTFLVRNGRTTRSGPEAKAVDSVRPIKTVSKSFMVSKERRSPYSR